MLDLDRELGVTRQVLDAMTVRARAIAHNVANQNTPGFKRYEVRFEEELRRAHAAGRSGATVQAKVVRDESGPAGQNNVSLFEEMAALDKVRLLYEVALQRAGSRFQRLNRAIFGR
jgi:flagellar basal-body rod protein FlgB